MDLLASSPNHYQSLTTFMGMRMSKNDLTIGKGEPESIKEERDTAVRGRPETESVVNTRRTMRSSGSVEVVQYMCRLFAIEYLPREDFEGGNYSATLFYLPRIRSIFGLYMLC